MHLILSALDNNMTNLQCRVIYRLMQAEIRKTKGVPSDIDELAAEALENPEDEPLLGSNPDV